MSREPFFNMRVGAPLWLLGVLIVLQLLFVGMPASWERWVLEQFALQPLALDSRSFLWKGVSLVSYGFLHADWLHLFVNGGMALAFGAATLRHLRFSVRRRYSGGTGAFFWIFFTGVVIGGVAQWMWWAVSHTEFAWAIGASGGVSALMATAAWAMGGSRQMLSFGIIWAVLNGLMVFGGPVLGFQLAWAAHMGGFLGGAILAPYIIENYSGWR